MQVAQNQMQESKKCVRLNSFLVLELESRRMIIELKEQQKPSSVASDSKRLAQSSSLYSQEQYTTISEQFGDN